MRRLLTLLVLRRTWLCVELREPPGFATPLQMAQVISRHWTRGRALAAANLYAESWRNSRGEVRGGRAYWNEARGRVVRYTGPLQTSPASRQEQLARLPEVTYFPVPLENAGDIHGR